MESPLPDGWEIKDNALVKTFVRASFAEAIGFVVEIARLAEAANHHPDILLQYRKVRLSLTTHDAGDTVTFQDFQLAEQIELISVASVQQHHQLL